MSLLFFFRSNYYVRRAPEYKEPDGVKRKRKKRKVYKVVYDRSRAEALPADVKAFAKDVAKAVSKLRRRKRDEEALIVLGILED